MFFNIIIPLIYGVFQEIELNFNGASFGAHPILSDK